MTEATRMRWLVFQQAFCDNRPYKEVFKSIKYKGEKRSRALKGVVGVFLHGFKAGKCNLINCSYCTKSAEINIFKKRLEKANSL